MSRPRSTAGVVLAAGASSRMGSPKPLLPLGDRSYLEVVVDKLRRVGLDPVVVVLGCWAEEVLEGSGPLSARVVIHAGWHRGMLSSLQAGLRALGADEAGGAGDPGRGQPQPRDRPRVDAAVVAPVDIPAFSPDTVAALVKGRKRSGAPIVLPEHDGEHGHPVLFGREVWTQLLETGPGGGARTVVDAHRSELLSVRVEDPWILRDSDTPEEYRRMIRELEREPDAEGQPGADDQ